VGRDLADIRWIDVDGKTCFDMVSVLDGLGWEGRGREVAEPCGCLERRPLLRAGAPGYRMFVRSGGSRTRKPYLLNSHDLWLRVTRYACGRGFSAQLPNAR